MMKLILMISVYATVARTRLPWCLVHGLVLGFVIWLGLVPVSALADSALSSEGSSLADGSPFAEGSPVAEGSLDSALAALNTRSFETKAAAAQSIADSGDERAETILRALLEGDLYRNKADDRVVIGEAVTDGYQMHDAQTGDDLGTVGKRSLKKIRVNNALRSTLRGLIANIHLAHPDPAVRLAAIETMMSDLDAPMAQRLGDTLPTENDPEVRQAINTALSLQALDDPDTRLEAIGQLQHVFSAPVRNRLQVLVDDEAIDLEASAAAQRLLGSIDARIERYEWFETLFFGVSLGSILVLAAIGLAITFGVMGVINMAHGELIMLGAYTTYVVQEFIMPNHIGWSLLVAIPLAFLVSGLIGVIIERGIIRHLYGRPLETLLATFGVSLILQQAVRTIFGPLNRSVITPEWMSGSLQINDFFSLTYNRLYVIVFCVLVFFMLLTILKRTRLGLEVRAVTQNRAMAQAMGIRSARVDAMTFGLGSGIAGIAGVALSQLTNVGPNLGQAYIVDSFMVVVFGGVGNLWGTFISGMSLGIGTKMIEPWTGSVMAKILILVFIILFIQKRPRGLFPQKGRAAEG
jgi:urea transport system permease protein